MVRNTDAFNNEKIHEKRQKQSFLLLLSIVFHFNIVVEACH